MSLYTHPGAAARAAAAAMQEAAAASAEKQPDLLKVALEKAAAAFIAISKMYHGS